MKLTSVKTGTWVVVQALPDDPGAQQEVRSLAVNPGRPIRVIRRAPLWGPLLLDVNGSTRALRWKTASRVEVEAVPYPDV